MNRASQDPIGVFDSGSEQVYIFALFFETIEQIVRKVLLENLRLENALAVDIVDGLHDLHLLEKIVMGVPGFNQ